jgi:hypothetical protein
MSNATPSVSVGSAGPVNRHAPTAVERQRSQLDRLLKDPVKPAFVPPPPKEKTIRPPREMMKNVQGSSAGAGSGEFHVYKASRRREYERLKLLEETSQKVRCMLPLSVFNFSCPCRKSRKPHSNANDARLRNWLNQKLLRTGRNDRRRRKDLKQKVLCRRMAREMAAPQ